MRISAPMIGGSVHDGLGTNTGQFHVDWLEVTSEEKRLEPSKSHMASKEEDIDRPT